MGNPVEVERKFRALQLTLQYALSPRRKFLSIISFLQELQPDARAYEPHILELCQLLPEVLSASDFTGSDPATLRQAEDILTTLRSVLPVLGEVCDFDHSMDLLRERTALQYERVWEPTVAAEIRARITNPEAVRSMARPSESTQGIFVPVVEHTLLSFGQDSHPGVLRRVSLRFMGQATSVEDELQTDVTVLTDGSKAKAFYKEPLRAARSLLAVTHKKAKIPPLEGRLNLDNRFAMHVGNSANLAIAASAYCAFVNHLNRRELYTLNANAAMTGDVDETGMALPVDASSLGPKLDAVFFSDAMILVVPRAQLTLAEEHLQRLLRRYPKRALQIVGVGSLAEIFFDRRISDINRISVMSYGARTLRQHWLTVLLSSMLLIIALYLVWRFATPIDMNATTAELEGEILSLKNVIGQPVAQIQVSKETIDMYLNQGIGHYSMWALKDIDGDGVNEFFYAVWGFDAGEHYLVCRSISGDSVMWRKKTEKSMMFPYRPDIQGPTLRPKNIAVDDFDGDGRFEVVVNALHTGAPSVVFKLDARTGEEISHYVHTGQFGSLLIVDINGDGIQEIVLTGVNNGFHDGCIVVLDPRFVTGVSPHTVDYNLAGYRPAVEMYYLRIPRTIVGNAMRDAAPYNYGTTINASRNEQRLSFIMVDDPGQGMAARAYYFVHLDFAMKLVSVSASDGYAELARELYSEKRIAAIPDLDYFRQYEQTIQYWDGSAWVGSRVINSRYRERLLLEGIPIRPEP
jgi:hypothetical protein